MTFELHPFSSPLLTRAYPFLAGFLRRPFPFLVRVRKIFRALPGYERMNDEYVCKQESRESTEDFTDSILENTPAMLDSS